MIDILLVCGDMHEYVKTDGLPNLIRLIKTKFDIEDPVLYRGDNRLTDFSMINNNDIIIIKSQIVEELEPTIAYSSPYINVQYGIHDIPALVDTGAQSSVMSSELANILFLRIDTDYSGIAKGVGSARIMGIVRIKIHIQKFEYIQIFQIIENDDPNLMILGMDIISTYGWVINARKRVIIIDNINPVSYTGRGNIVDTTRKLENIDRSKLYTIVKNICNSYDKKFQSINAQKISNELACVLCKIGFTLEENKYVFHGIFGYLENLCKILG